MAKRHHSIRPVHPGEILREDVLPEITISKVQLAANLHISRQALYAILKEKQGITAPMAIRLGKLFGNSPEYWLNLQKNYDLAVARSSTDVSDIKPLVAA